MIGRYCWWETFLTDHQAYTTAELARVSGTRIEVFCVEEENAIRKAQGWTNGHQHELEMQPFPRSWLPFVWRVISDRKDAVHVFAGPFGSARLTMAMLLAVMRGCRVYMLTEPYSPIQSGYFDDRAPIGTLIKSKLRPPLYRLYGMVFGPRLEGVFAISRRAIAQVRAIGFDTKDIFPFGYFVPSSDAPQMLTRGASAIPRLVFVGTLNETKGVDLLVEAAHILEQRGVPLLIDVYGHGDKNRFGLDTANVRYRGPIPFGRAQAVICTYDYLVLPSRYDGWGVVVNEALQAGVPVICSDSAGASALVETWGCGFVYRHSGALEIADAIERVTTDPDALRAMRSRCAAIQAVLDPRVAGQYVFDVISRSPRAHARITNPWYR